ncbi:hypothetical protein GUJ93_ZPchr0008g13969 [Zizania palustris]|uniref:Uncharacterized protein n=1 Tax=Zizania palustris TaxID=103762 RepID=A0A8J5VFR3_ZIZPA|nr:hypothetical protein GUJ93_ZPchr0008g13969 [Zizania palustris]
MRKEGHLSTMAQPIKFLFSILGDVHLQAGADQDSNTPDSNTANRMDPIPIASSAVEAQDSAASSVNHGSENSSSVPDDYTSALYVFEAVHGLLNRAEALVASKNVSGGAAAASAAMAQHSTPIPSPRHRKNARFLHRPEDPSHHDVATTSAMADGVASAKRRKTRPPVDDAEPTMPMHEKEQIARMLSSLWTEVPAPKHIAYFMRRECSWWPGALSPTAARWWSTSSPRKTPLCFG